MGLFSQIAQKASIKNMGDVAGHDFPLNSTFHVRSPKTDMHKIDLMGHDGYGVVVWDGGEFEFNHMDIESACICCGGPVPVSNGLSYSAKYRVILKDGKDFIITGYNRNSCVQIEHVIF